MKLLFIHQNFPSQYRHLAEYYAADPANQVVGLGEGGHLRVNYQVPGSRLVGYQTPEPPGRETYFLAQDFEAAARRAMQAAGALKALKESGFEPDLILIHPDWGEGLLLKVYYPDTPLLAYAEFYNAAWSEDLDFSPAFAPSEGMRCLAEIRNAVRAPTLAAADHLSSPFNFQRDLLPESLRRRTSLLHDGIDTDWFKPIAGASLTIAPDEDLFGPDHAPLPGYVPRRKQEITLGCQDEVFTFGTRALEPYRGWASFARALPRIQRERPNAHCLILGRSHGCYGPPPEGEQAGRSWRDIFLDPVKDHLDFSRIHFLGNISHDALHRLYCLSRAHVYLTYPLMLSYSVLEAMSCATPLVLSNTAPVREVARPEQNCLLVDFHDPEEIAAAVCRLLADGELGRRLGKGGREFAVSNYDLRRVWLPRWDRVVNGLARGEALEPL